MIHGRTRLHVVANGTMTGQRYIDEVLLPHVRLFRGAVGDKFYPGKGPISDMQYHGVSRHHDPWPHAPTCGCEWDYDGPTIH
ncbi:hypothetical protein TNCV_5040211 [Trichonephila clavipes]|nr:hypothetical protein TNCV_5040211 [Trichonephila clavipes]